jgi:hypothetical protein
MIWALDFRRSSSIRSSVPLDKLATVKSNGLFNNSIRPCIAARTEWDVDWGKNRIEETKPKPTPIAEGSINLLGKVPLKEVKRGPYARKRSEIIVPKI